MAGGFDVRKVARLASLGLTPEEEKRLEREFAAILEFVAQVRSLPLDGVPPAVHAVAPPLPREGDDARAGIATGEALLNAPDRLGGFFKVPPVLPGAAEARE